MAQYTGEQGAFTPSTSQDNWTLDGNASGVGNLGMVKMISWGGNGTTSVGYRTRWCRPTTVGSGAFTTLTTQATSPATTAVLRYGTFATAPILPTDPANLFAQNWNVLGGGGVIVLPIGGEWMVVGITAAANGQISCRNTVGTDASLSSYGVQWAE
jgi:hypothetical protein